MRTGCIVPASKGIGRLGERVTSRIHRGFVGGV